MDEKLEQGLWNLKSLKCSKRNGNLNIYNSETTGEQFFVNYIYNILEETKGKGDVV